MFQLNVFVYNIIVLIFIVNLSGGEQEINDMDEARKLGQDPVIELENILYAHMFGNRSSKIINHRGYNDSETHMKYPSGSLLRTEYFKGKKAVHAPFPDVLMLSGVNKLNVTRDHMQTAIDAFAIICYGYLDDIKQLPPRYVLLSAQTISMMKVAREKLTALWSVVKGRRHPSRISSTVLELYRPLFKYLSGREMAKLNLTDEKIIWFIGTHEDLSRHQVGVVVSAYIKQNPRWASPYYLNTMNNLICGLSINYMRRIPINSYLQLSPEVFYHIRSCDGLQKKFLLKTMSKTQLLGKPFSWTIQELSRLGLILTAVKGSDLASITPDAFVGLTSQVMKEMDPVNLQYLNQKQIQKMSKKVYNIMAKKMQTFKAQYDTLNMANKFVSLLSIKVIHIICMIIF